MPELLRSTAYRIGHRLRRVVRRAERFDRQISHFGFIFLLNSPPVDVGVDMPPHSLARSARAVKGRAVFFGESARAADMVGMFMGEEQGGNILRLALDMLQPFFKDARPDADVDQDTRLFAFNINGVALTAAGKYGKLKNGFSFLKKNRRRNPPSPLYKGESLISGDLPGPSSVKLRTGFQEGGVKTLSTLFLSTDLLPSLNEKSLE